MTTGSGTQFVRSRILTNSQENKRERERESERERERSVVCGLCV